MDAASFLELLVFLITFCLDLDPPAPVSWMLVEHSLVDSLENIRLLNLSRVAFIGNSPGNDQRSQTS